MFGALGNTWRYNFYMVMKNEMNLEKLFQIFDSHLYIKDTHVSNMSVQGSHTFAMFYVHARMKNGECLYCMRILY